MLALISNYIAHCRFSFQARCHLYRFHWPFPCVEKQACLPRSDALRASCRISSQPFFVSPPSCVKCACLPDSEVRRRRLLVLICKLPHGADKSAFALDVSATEEHCHWLGCEGLLLDILNPKSNHFLLGVSAAICSAGTTEPLVQFLVLSGTFMAMTFAVFVVYGLLAHGFRKAVIESPRVQTWLRRSFAATFASLGANLALSEE